MIPPWNLSELLRLCCNVVPRQRGERHDHHEEWRGHPTLVRRDGDQTHQPGGVRGAKRLLCHGQNSGLPGRHRSRHGAEWSVLLGTLSLGRKCCSVLTVFDLNCVIFPSDRWNHYERACSAYDQGHIRPRACKTEGRGPAVHHQKHPVRVTRRRRPSHQHACLHPTDTEHTAWRFSHPFRAQPTPPHSRHLHSTRALCQPCSARVLTQIRFHEAFPKLIEGQTP